MIIALQVIAFFAGACAMLVGIGFLLGILVRVVVETLTGRRYGK